MSGKFKYIIYSIILASFLVYGNKAFADVTVYESEDKAQALKVGAALKSGLGLNLTSGEDTSPDFALNNARIYTDAQVLEGVGFRVSAEYVDGGDFSLLDGFAYAKISDQLQFRAGQTKAPFDRATLSTPFNQLTWEDSIISKYPQVNGDDRRSRGGAVWGTYAIPVEGVDAGPIGTLTPTLKYQGGVFEGVQDPADIGDLLFAGRVTLNLLDAENDYDAPGNYFGGKSVLALGTSIAFQKDAVGVARNKDYLAWNADLLFESAIEGAPGVFTLGAAVNLYDLDDAEYVPGVGLNEGVGFSVQAAWLAPYEVPAGPISGKVQPFVQYQQFNFDGFADGDEKQVDAGFNYIIAPNVLVTASYFHNEMQGTDSDGINLGFRFDF